MSIDILLAAIGTPELPGAACKGQHRIFDPRLHSDPDRERMQRRALCLCRHCPALCACASWLATLPPNQRPLGVVVAGHVQRAKSRGHTTSPREVPPTSPMRRAALAAIADHERAMPRAAAQKAARGRKATSA